MLKNYQTYQKPINYWKIGTIILSVILLLLLIGWFIASPFLAVWAMQDAAQRRDADAFCRYIDFPRLRESMKSELNAKILEGYTKNQSMKDNPFSGLAVLAGPALVNMMIDGYVSEAGIAQMFQSVPVETNQNASAAAANDTVREGLAPDFFNARAEERINLGYESINEFRALRINTKTGKYTQYIFERRGLWGWQLVAIKFRD